MGKVKSSRRRIFKQAIGNKELNPISIVIFFLETPTISY